MNHSEAIEANAAASYLRGDLSGAERDAFEVHTIDCPICAEAVWTGVKAANEAPSIPQPLPKPLPFRQRGRQWLATAAAAVFAFVLGGQMLRPAAPMFEVADPGGAMTGIMRGPEDQQLVVNFEQDRPIEIVVTTPTDRRYPAYRVELRDEADKVLHEIDLTPKQALHDVGIPVLLRPLPAGRYVLAILGVPKGGNPEKLDQKRVVVQ